MGGRAALVFPGQGSQRAGMLENVPELDSLCRLLDAAEALSGFDLRGISESGTPAELSDTRVAQPLLYLADWAWGVTLVESGIVPVAVAGHSLGEFAALAVAEVFSPEAGLELVVERSRYMATAVSEAPGTMSAVLGLDAALVADTIAEIPGVWLANDNSVGQVVISGTHEGVSEAASALASAGARRVVPLPVSGPFHSPLMARCGRVVRPTALAGRVQGCSLSGRLEHRSLAGDRCRAASLEADDPDDLPGALDRDDGGTRCRRSAHVDRSRTGSRSHRSGEARRGCDGSRQSRPRAWNLSSRRYCEQIEQQGRAGHRRIERYRCADRASAGKGRSSGRRQLLSRHRGRRPERRR